MNKPGLYVSMAHTLGIPQPGVQPWWEYYKVLTHAITVVDRTGYYHLPGEYISNFQMPYNFKVYPSLVMPPMVSGFNKTYEQCCHERVEYILEQSQTRNLPIYVMWSGGIDSTTVLVAFMKSMTDHELKNNLVVLLTQDSINENPNFYYNHIRKRCRIMSSEGVLSLLNKKQIIVDGEHNDQLMGADSAITSLLAKDPNYDWNQPWTREKLVKFYLHRGMTNLDYVNRWVDLFTSSASRAPCEVKSFYEYLWWINFNFKWQNVYFRMLLRADVSVRSFVDRDLADNYVYHFFNNYDFQRWSMANPHLKVGKTWNTYKFTSKDYIYDYDKNAEYRDYKVKDRSLYKIFLAKNPCMAIDDQMQYLPWVDHMKYYNRDNYFV
jgi:hypothetical protein